jgi:hypothetical protein
MEPARTRPQRADFPLEHLPRSRADLVGYFAWGYLSRRELNERLMVADPRMRQQSRQRPHGSKAA